MGAGIGCEDASGRQCNPEEVDADSSKVFQTTYPCFEAIEEPFYTAIEDCCCALETSHGTGLNPEYLGEDVYCISIVRQGDLKLGLDLELGYKAGMPVRAITGGLVEKWNAAHPDCQVAEGDILVEVNGVEDNSRRMLNICLADPILTMKLVRKSKFKKKMQPYNAESAASTDSQQVCEIHFQQDNCSGGRQGNDAAICRYNTECASRSLLQQMLINMRVMRMCT